MAPKSSKQSGAAVAKENGKFDLGFLQSGLMLYHKRDNRHIQVQISEDKQLEKPVLAANPPANGDLEQIPCEIVGLDAKKAKKPIKIRFNPEVLSLAKWNENMARSVHQTVKKLIEDFLGQDWTMERPQIDEIPKDEVDALRKAMLAEHIHMHFDEQNTELRWHITSPPAFLLPVNAVGISAAVKTKTKKRNLKKNPAMAAAPLAQFEVRVRPAAHLPPDAAVDSALKELNSETHAHAAADQTDVHQQRVELLLNIGGSTVHSLFAVDFHSFHPLIVAESGKENDHSVQFLADVHQLQIRLKHAGVRAASSYGHSAVSISGCHNKMIDCAQIRLESLRHHVKQSQHRRNGNSTAASQTPKPRSPPAAVRLPESLEDCGPVAAAFHTNRVALFQLTNTPRPISMSRFTVVPVATNNADVPLRSAMAAHRPLHVRVTADEPPRGPKMSAAAHAEITSGSPADSVDSAVVMSGDDDDTLSPLPAQTGFHFNATSHRTPDVQPRFRARSSSECWDFRGPVHGPTVQKCAVPAPTKLQLVSAANPSTLSMSSTGSTASLSPNGTPLRSILKKPKVPPPPGLGNTTVQAFTASGGMRRVPTRYVLARSVSECQDDAAAGMLMDASAMAANFSLLDEEVVSMEDLVAAGVNGSPLSVCAEVDEDSDEPEQPTAEQQRTKRVSFNEQVQARIYRSTSSILANRNKADRRARNALNKQRRRAESESMDGVEEATPPAALYYVPTIPLAKTSAEDKSQDEFGDQDDADANNGAGQLGDRRDSGIDDEPVDSGVDSPPHARVESPKRVQRVISADSAIGDDSDLQLV